jgi:alpha-N-arabinofuranosidase
MDLHIDRERTIGKRNPMIYGHFLEHFHRMVYGGVYDPASKFADSDGFREDVIEALQRVKTPVIRWPGGCFVSAYHWKDGVGKTREASYNKAWFVEEPNTFGTDEFVKLCRKIGAEPYICTNLGTGTAEEASDWVEYCNLKNQGRFAKMRIANGSTEPFGVKYWSLGNENYGHWEIGAKKADEWAELVTETAKMMHAVDSSLELSAAATGRDWTRKVLESAGRHLRWISIHGYWDNNRIDDPDDPERLGTLADFDQSMAISGDLDIKWLRGLLSTLGLEKKIKVAYDEWNLRGWYHPFSLMNYEAWPFSNEKIISLRDRNDDNSQYTMADAAFSACFLNMCLRNCDVIGMANFSPFVNGRGAICTHKDGLVLRPTFHVFDLYANCLGDTVLDTFSTDETLTLKDKSGREKTISALDTVATLDGEGKLILAVVNRDSQAVHKLNLRLKGWSEPQTYRIQSLVGASADAYNDVGHTDAAPEKPLDLKYEPGSGISLPPHSVNIVTVG